MMEGLHTCANCHSFSADGKTLGMDLDGPKNDKGLYTLAPIKPDMPIGTKDVIEWSTFRGKHDRDHAARLHVAGLTRTASSSSP